MRITEPISVTVLLIAVLVPHSAGLSQTQKRSSVRTLDALAEGVDMGSDTVKVFEDDTHSATFRLFTSWIHGEKHQDYIRIA